ncbi:hypothetical protein ACHWQZ_G017228 [Mnemiopsis leidyi]
MEKKEELAAKKENKENQSEAPDGVEDTVGVVCVDSCGNLTCTTSSGGSVFKYSGRLGQCCTHGAGSYSTPTCGIVTTGNGEQIINKLLAVTVANKLSHCDNPCGVLDDCFVEGEQRMCGFLAVQLEGDGRATVHAQHTLTNMVIGFQSGTMEKPVVRVVSSHAPVFIQTVQL